MCVCVCVCPKYYLDSCIISFLDWSSYNSSFANVQKRI